MSESECKGCKTLGLMKDPYVCDFIRHSDKCPCIECLIKPMCGTACKEYNAFYEKYRNYDEEGR